AHISKARLYAISIPEISEITFRVIFEMTSAAVGALHLYELIERVISVARRMIERVTYPYQPAPHVITVSVGASKRRSEFDDLALLVPFKLRRSAERVNSSLQVSELIVNILAAMTQRINRGSDVPALVVFPPELRPGLIGQLLRQRVPGVIEPANRSVRMRDADAVKLRIV